MGYDVQFVQVEVPLKTRFPVDQPRSIQLLGDMVAFDDLEAVRATLLEIKGCRPGPGNAVDYLGRGLNHARFFARRDAIHVENDCNAGELVKVFNHLAEVYPTLLIFDLQSKQLHTADSYTEWWTRPL